MSFPIILILSFVSLTHFHAHTLSFSLTHTVSVSHSFLLSLSLNHSLVSLSLSHTLSFFLPLLPSPLIFLCPTPSLSHISFSLHFFHLTFCLRFRDRSPFVLTSDMAYVINGGDKPSHRFQHFVDLCCQAFNILRHKTDLFLSLLSLVSG